MTDHDSLPPPRGRVLARFRSKLAREMYRASLQYSGPMAAEMRQTAYGAELEYRRGLEAGSKKKFATTHM